MGLQRHFVVASALALLGAAGCASARLVLEQPVAEQCTSAGLDGCPELTEGVILYVEGKPAEGTAKIEEGARENEPEKLREFASTVEKVTSLPGVSSYAGPIHSVAAILAGSAREREEALARKKAAEAERLAAREKPKRRPSIAKVPAETTDGVVPVAVDLTTDPDDAQPRPSGRASPMPEIQGGTIIPMPETGAVPCQMGAPVGATMLCLTATIGPLVLTDVHASGECRLDLFVVAGTPEAPRWMLSVPARTALHITGARLFARGGEPIAIAVSEKTRADARCAVTWSGSRP